MQTFLGHSSPAFTLAVYVHFLEGDMPSVAFLDRGQTASAAEAPNAGYVASDAVTAFA